MANTRHMTVERVVDVVAHFQAAREIEEHVGLAGLTKYWYDRQEMQDKAIINCYVQTVEQMWDELEDMASHDLESARETLVRSKGPTRQKES